MCSILPEQSTLLNPTVSAMTEVLPSRLERLCLPILKLDAPYSECRQEAGNMKVTMSKLQRVSCSYSSVGIATRLWARLSGIRDRFLVGVSDCSYISSTQTICGAHPISYVIGTGCDLPRELKRLEHETDHSHLVRRLRVVKLLLYPSIHLLGVMRN
jgi:hypothetical protein